MPRDIHDDDEIDTAHAAELLDELELNQAVDVHELRERATTYITADVVVRPSNLRERATTVAAGKARELQRQSVTCVLDQPLTVGDVFYITLDAADFDLAPSLAICEKCSLLDGPGFESRFRFVQDVHLTQRSE